MHPPVRAYERRGGTGGRGRPFVTSILSEIQAGYDQRAQQAVQASVSPQEPPVRRKATRTYTGEALARRQAWGRERAIFGKQLAAQLRASDQEQ